jgi:hypothetical protein
MTRFGLLPAVQIPGSTITIWIGNGENRTEPAIPKIPMKGDFAAKTVVPRLNVCFFLSVCAELLDYGAAITACRIAIRSGRVISPSPFISP